MDPFLPLGGERKAGEGGRQRKHKPNNLEIFQSRGGRGEEVIYQTQPHHRGAHTVLGGTGSPGRGIAEPRTGTTNLHGATTGGHRSLGRRSSQQ